MSKGTVGRPKTRWEDDVLEDIKIINIGNWKKVAQNRDNWKKVVDKPEPYIGCSALEEEDEDEEEEEKEEDEEEEEED